MCSERDTFDGFLSVYVWYFLGHTLITLIVCGASCGNALLAEGELWNQYMFKYNLEIC